jgi:hypothetical protein
MVDYARVIEIVNGMFQAKRHRHGDVTLFLAREGVARSTAYRWKEHVAWWIEEGPEELRRVSAERDELQEALTRLVETPPAAGLKDPETERRFMLEAQVRGISTRDVADLLAVGGGRSVDPKTVERVVARFGVPARVLFGRYFAGVVRVAAGDEIFTPGPLLLMVDPLSLLITALRLAEGRAAEDWKEVFDLMMNDLERFVSDRGRGLVAAGKEAGVAAGADQWHLLHAARQWMGTLGRRSLKSIEAEYAAQAALATARTSKGEKAIRRAKKAYAEARRVCKALLEEFDRLEPLMAKVTEAFDYVTSDGHLNMVSRAHETVRNVVAQMGTTKKGRALAAQLSGLSDPLAFTHLEVLEEGLRKVQLAEVGEDRERLLVRLVRATQAWRRHDKSSVDELAAAATSLADWVEIEVIRVFDLAFRSSSYVECVNGRIRLIQITRKRFTEDFLYLVAVHHNMTPFGRGSVRKGHSPAELAGLRLPSNDWIELLELTAKELEASAAQAL